MTMSKDTREKIAWAGIGVGIAALMGVGVWRLSAHSASAVVSHASACETLGRQTTLPYLVLDHPGASMDLLWGSAKLLMPAVYRVTVSGSTVTETEMPGSVGTAVTLPPVPPISQTVDEWAQVQIVPAPLRASGFAAYTPMDRAVGIDLNGQRISLSLPSVAGSLHPEIGSGGDEPLPVSATVRTSTSSPILWWGVEGRFGPSAAVRAGQAFAINWPLAPTRPLTVTFHTTSPSAAQKLAAALAYHPHESVSGSMTFETLHVTVIQ